MPLQERPAKLVPPTYMPPGVPYPVKTGETWIGLAKANAMDPWDMIDFNFPGTKQVRLVSFQRATRYVNWYLNQYVGCRKASHDGFSWAFSSGTTAGLGAWKGGVIWLPKKAPKAAPTAPPVRPDPTPANSTQCGARRPEMYRLLDQPERQLASRVFGPTLPPLDQIAIGNGLGAGGAPWTSDGFFSSGVDDPGAPNAKYAINLGNVAWLNLNSTGQTSAVLCGDYGRIAELFIHEMTHVWQMYNDSSHVMVRSFYAQKVGAGYDFAAGDPWDSYNVEQQATIVERWLQYKIEGSPLAKDLFPYVRLVLWSGKVDFPRAMNLVDLKRDLARAFPDYHG